MPTFPLLDLSPPHADGWHAVTAPGGYEWWYFDAEDAENDRQFVAIFFEGFVFHPGYLRADARYRRRPTRVSPAVPRDFPCVYFVLYEKGKIRRQFMTQFAAADFAAARDRLDVRIGTNLINGGDGRIHLQLAGTPWSLTARGPRIMTGERLAAAIEFEPLPTPAIEPRRFLSRPMTGGDHYWLLANPLCRVQATIEVDGESMVFAGRGYHDHNYGSAPLGPGLKRWLWGRVLQGDSACVFHHAEPRDPQLPAEVHLLSVEEGSLRETVIAMAPHVRYARTPLGLAYPTALQLDSELMLREPRVIDAAPFYLRLQYAAHWKDQISTAFCEIAYPHRLRWPVLGRMIEMSIHKP